MSDKIQGESKMKTSHKNKIVVVGAGSHCIYVNGEKTGE